MRKRHSLQGQQSSELSNWVWCLFTIRKGCTVKYHFQLVNSKEHDNLRQMLLSVSLKALLFRGFFLLQAKVNLKFSAFLSSVLDWRNSCLWPYYHNTLYYVLVTPWICVQVSRSPGAAIKWIINFFSYGSRGSVLCLLTTREGCTVHHV